MIEPSAIVPIGVRSVCALALAATRWPWLNQILAAWLVVMLALCLGLLSFAAVREMTIECRREPIYLTTERGDRLTLDDGTTYLVAEQKRRQCQLALGEVGISLPWHD
jgi:hypothetical protein